MRYMVFPVCLDELSAPCVCQTLEFCLLLVRQSQSLKIRFEFLQSMPIHTSSFALLATPELMKFHSAATTSVYSLLAPPESLEGSNSLPA